MAEISERMIFCYRVSTLVVGWLQVAGSLLLICRLLSIGKEAFLCSTCIHWTVSIGEGINCTSTTPLTECGEEFNQSLLEQDFQRLEVKLTWMLALAILGVHLESITFFMGVVLVHGVDKKRPDLICKWLNWAYIFQLISLIWWVFLLVFMESSRPGNCIVFRSVFQGFCIWVVNDYMKLLMDQGWDRRSIVET